MRLPGNLLHTARPRLFAWVLACLAAPFGPTPAAAQSPSYSVTLTLADTVGGAMYYTERTWCELPEAVQTTPATPFSADTSAIAWQALPAEMLAQATCTHRTFTGDSLHFSNQGWIFEHLFRFQIVRFRPNLGQADTMTIAFPIQEHAFITTVNLQAIPFQPGYFDLTDQLWYIADTTRTSLWITIPPRDPRTD